MLDRIDANHGVPDDLLETAGATGGHRGRSLLHDTRGAAMSEATIVVPLLAIILGGLIYIHDVYGAKLDAAAEARQCALQAASGGCNGRAPAGCRATSQRLSLTAQVSRSMPVLQRLVRRLDRLPRIGHLYSDLDRVLQIAQEVSRDVRLPDVLADRNRRIRDTQRFICGEKKRSMPGNLFERLFCRYASSLC